MDQLISSDHSDIDIAAILADIMGRNRDINLAYLDNDYLRYASVCALNNA